MSSIQSICVLRLSAIGDVCHAVAVVQAIQAYYPEAKITWIIGRVEAALLKQLPNVRFVVFDKQQGFSAYRQLRKQLPEQFDVLLHMQVALRANIAAACVRAKRRIGFPEHLSKEGHGLVVNERVRALPQPHVLDGFAAFAHAIGVPEFTPAWNIPLQPEVLDWLDVFCSEHALEQQKILVISPSASNAERNWLPERYAQVADYAVSKGFAVLLCGGPADHEKALGLAIEQQSVSPLINVIGQTSLLQLLALLKRADIVVSPDSGPAHMATTQGTPVIGLYAHSNPARTGPYNSLQWVVEVYHQHLLRQKGSPPHRWGVRVKGADLMADISVESVVQMFDAVCSQASLIND